MGEITTRANDAFRNYVTNNVPSSGIHEPEKSAIRGLFATVDSQVTRAASDAAAAVEWAQIAALTTYGFETLADLEAFTTAADNASATVWGDTDANNGIYHWDDGGSVWVRDADNVQQTVAGLSTFLATQPTGDDEAVTFVNGDGYGLGRFSAAGLQEATTDGLSTDMETVIDLPSGFGYWPTGGGTKEVQDDGWATGIVGGDGTSAASDTITDDQVAAVLRTDVGTQNFYIGDNCLLRWTESKTFSALGTAVSAIMTNAGQSLPVGTTLSSRSDSHPGHDLAELIGSTDVASLKSVIDAGFAAGAECIPAVVMAAMCNSMLVDRVSAGAWEADLLTARALVQRLCLQGYLGTDPAAVLPVPPIGLVVDCTYSGDATASRAIPLRFLEMTRQHFDLCAIAPDYLCEMAAGQGDLTAAPTGVHWTGGSTGDIATMTDYAAEWIRSWYFDHKRLNGAQVVEHWSDGLDYYLRVAMPKPPLVFDDGFVATIANQGLSIVTSSGSVPTISNLEIIGGGQVIHFTSSASLSGGGRARGAWSPTTAGHSGRNSGARMTIHDSSTAVGSTGRTLHHYLMPFEVVFP